MDPIECAKRGNINFFKEVGVDAFQKTTPTGGSVLVVAVMVRQLNCCKVIYERCPELLYIADRKGHTALHHAAWRGFDDIVEFLISAAIEREQLLMMINSDKKQTALHSAVLKDHLQCAKLLLKADPSNKLLRTFDKAKETAMHIAVRNHNREIVDLLLETDPGFYYEPNKSWQTPHLIAVQESSTGDRTAVEIRNLLIEKQPHECKKQVGANDWTLLHHATQRADVESIKHILEFCPDCVKMVDNQGQNFVHLAAKLEHDTVIRCILTSRRLNKHVLNQQDKDGNTPLHIVALEGNAKVGLHLLYDSRVNKLVLNKEDQIALAMIKFDYDKRRAEVYGLIEGADEKELKDRRDFDLVVGALIATVSFTSGIMVPGGFFNDGLNKGNAILHSKPSFQAFVVSNTIAMVLSLYAVFCHFCARNFIKERDVIFQLKVAKYCILGAIFAMMLAFITGSYAILVISDWLCIFVFVICFGFFGFASLAIWRMIEDERQKREARAGLKKRGISLVE